MTLLSVTGLEVTLPTASGSAPILTGIDLTLERGESLGLVGESGCGKSMTALAIMGLLPRGARVAGAVSLAGQSLVGLDDRALSRLRGRHMAMIFQEPMSALNPVMTIGAQIVEGPMRHLKMSRRAARDRARELLDRVGLPPGRFPLSLYPHELSGGQRQRVVIALALSSSPALLIADEPTTALDVTVQSQILDLIADVVSADGMGLVMITHDLGVVAEMTDRVAVMYSGRVVETGTTADVFAEMGHPYTRGLFRAMPSSDLVGSGAIDDGPPAGPLATIPGTVPDPRARPSGCVFRPRCARAIDACAAAPPPWRTLGADHDVLCLRPGRDGEAIGDGRPGAP